MQRKAPSVDAEMEELCVEGLDEASSHDRKIQHMSSGSAASLSAICESPVVRLMPRNISEKRWLVPVEVHSLNIDGKFIKRSRKKTKGVACLPRKSSCRASRSRYRKLTMIAASK